MDTKLHIAVSCPRSGPTTAKVAMRIVRPRVLHTSAIHDVHVGPNDLRYYKYFWTASEPPDTLRNKNVPCQQSRLNSLRRCPNYQVEKLNLTLPQIYFHLNPTWILTLHHKYIYVSACTSYKYSIVFFSWYIYLWLIEQPTGSSQFY